MEYLFAGIIVVFMGACAIAPMLFGSMSKEDRDAAGIVWQDNHK